MNAAPPPGQSELAESQSIRRIALFGGTFDPIHVGHLAVARAAERRFHLDEIHFVPSGHPPHKHRSGMASYADRYAMAALACADHPRFIPSLAESGSGHSGREIFYSVDTVRRFKQKLQGTGAHLYFLLGADSFLQIPTWKDYETLLGLCDFIVASRPGFQSSALRMVIPPELFARKGSADAPLDPRAIALRRTVIYVLDTVSSHVSATEVRERLDSNQSIHGLVPPRVEEYIKKQALYR
ncbi:MAG: nicotinate-nucleotide adenylyltransferase [Candidatus Acidiferrales bacterium]